MTVTAIATSGLQKAEAGIQSTAQKLSTAADSADTVSLSDAAVALIGNRNLFSANIQSLKVADEIQKEALSIIG